MADATLSLAVTTELEAVNTMLRGVGVAPVSDLDEPKNISAVNALKTLRSVSRAVQNKGWWFNTEYDVEMALDGDSKIPVTSDILFIRTWGRDRWRKVTKRGGFLYDLSNNTYVFSGTIRVLLRRFLSFEDIPEVARHFITVRAAREHKANDVGHESGSDFGYSEQDEMDAYIALRQTQGEAEDNNILYDSADVFRTLDRSPYQDRVITDFMLS